MKGKKNWEAAAQEAKEEAGVIGKPSKKPLGEYLYAKRRAGQSDLLCRVEVYAMNCDKLLDTFREKGQRELRWFDFADAVEIVEEPGLMALLRGVDLTPFQKPVKRKSSARAATEHRSATESKSLTKLKSSAKTKTSTKAKSPAKRKSTAKGKSTVKGKSTAKRKLPAGDKSIAKPNKKHIEKSAAF